MRVEMEVVERMQLRLFFCGMESGAGGLHGGWRVENSK